MTHEDKIFAALAECKAGILERLEILNDMAWNKTKEGLGLALDVVKSYPDVTVPLVIHNDHDQFLFNLSQRLKEKRNVSIHKDQIAKVGDVIALPRQPFIMDGYESKVFESETLIRILAIDEATRTITDSEIVSVGLVSK